MSDFVKMLRDIVRDKDAYSLLQQALDRQLLYDKTSKVSNEVVYGLLINLLGESDNIHESMRKFSTVLSENLALRHHPILINNPEHVTKILIKFCCALSMSGIFPGKFKKYRQIGHNMGCSIVNNNGSKNIRSSSTINVQNSELNKIYNSIMRLNYTTSEFDRSVSKLIDMITSKRIRKIEEIRPLVDKMQYILYDTYVQIYREISGGVDPGAIPIQYEQLLSTSTSGSIVKIPFSNSSGEKGLHQKTLSHLKEVLRESPIKHILINAYLVIYLYRKYAKKKYNLFLGKGRGYGGRVNIRNMKNNAIYDYKRNRNYSDIANTFESSNTHRHNSRNPYGDG